MEPRVYVATLIRSEAPRQALRPVLSSAECRCLAFARVSRRPAHDASGIAVLQRGLRAKDCHGWPMRARHRGRLSRSGQHNSFHHRGIDHVATHRGLRERIRAAVIGHGSCAIAHVRSETPPAARPRNRTITASLKPGCAARAARIRARSICRRRSSRRAASSRRNRSRPRAMRRSIASTSIRRSRSIKPATAT